MDFEDCCRHLAWDSAHFTRRIGRVNGMRLTPALVADIDRWSRHESIDCLYFLSEPDPESLRLAPEAGFRFVDSRITLTAEPGAPNPEEAASLRLATLNDIPDLRRIAGESYRDTRFYVDGKFPRAACDEMYRIWIERSCREPEFAGAVFVVDADDGTAGYISCRMAEDAGEIGLLAVDGRYRGLGLGERLVRRACSWFDEQGARRVSVVTQGANVAALRLYQRSGFLVSAVQLWYHRWAAR